MHELNRVANLLAARRPGHSLPRPFYMDPGIFALDLEAIFFRNWLMIGFEAELPQTGSHMATTIGGSPIVVVRQKNGDIAGFHNSCRHRGAQLCQDGAGRSLRIVCPYHQWTYDLDGRLFSARRQDDDFNPAAHALRPLSVACVEGCIYVCLAEDPPDFTEFRNDLAPMLAPHRLRDAKLAHVSTIIEKANWKLVMENGRECHHCAACHPELKEPFPVSSADRPDLEANAYASDYAGRMSALGLEVGPRDGAWWQIGRYPFNEGHVSFSLDGKKLVSRPLTAINDGDIGSLRWAIEPHNFCHAAGDSVFMFSAIPVGPVETLVTAKWLVHKDAVEGIDYDVDRLTYVWTQTNFQDRDLAENNQRGVNSIGYTPGPYSPDAEFYVNRFVDWYCSILQSYLAAARNHPGPS